MKLQEILQPLKDRPDLFSDSEIGLIEDAYKQGYLTAIRDTMNEMDDHFDGATDSPCDGMLGAIYHAVSKMEAKP